MIPAVVLAAGRSSRMGRPKALLPLASGETFVQRIVTTFLEALVDDIVIVLGHEPQPIIRSLTATGVRARYVINRHYDRGQLSSVLTGLNVVDRPGVRAALVTLVDVPLMSVATVRTVIDRYRETHAPVVRPTQGVRHGHPLLIDRSLFAALRAADPDAGIKPVIRLHASELGDVPVSEEGAFVDIDTEDEYRALLRPFQGGGGSLT
ncbi:MAG TPA: nucleotidyltransferase family protein [Vicinamibacterales bacterium]|nr:nucleotidyltransferase family protein [Vicinamibacterales bacterium]